MSFPTSFSSQPINNTGSNSINEFTTLHDQQLKSQAAISGSVTTVQVSCVLLSFPFPDDLNLLFKPVSEHAPLQCLVVRDEKNSMFHLHLAASSSLTEKGKFLMAAHRSTHGVHTEYIITLDPNDLSQKSNAYLGKLSSNFLATRFSIYDSHLPHNAAKSSKSGRLFTSKQVSPQVPACNFKIGKVYYPRSKDRKPRRMVVSAIRRPVSEEHEEAEPELTKSKSSQILLKNKPPRWHEQLKCWCLNFRGRVTVKSVKNFQLMAPTDTSQPGGKGDSETVLLQFGKVGDDLFTMEYRQTLSAFQAFAICLTSFGTKLERMFKSA